MIYTAIISLAAAYLLLLAFLMETENIQSFVIFRVFPLITGVPLSLLAFGRIMGWPIGAN